MRQGMLLHVRCETLVSTSDPESYTLRCESASTTKVRARLAAAKDNRPRAEESLPPTAAPGTPSKPCSTAGTQLPALSATTSRTAHFR